MAQIFKNPVAQAEAMGRPLKIDNPQAAITGGEGKVTTALIHNPLTQGFDSKSQQYKDYIGKINSQMREYTGTPEFKKQLLDAYFSDKDIPWEDYRGKLRKGFIDKYGYDEDIGRINNYYDKGGFSLGDTYTSSFGKGPDMLDKKLSLQNALSTGHLTASDIRDYFVKPYEEEKFEREQSDPRYWAQRVLEEPDEYDAQDINTAKYIVDRFMPEADEWLRKLAGK